MHGAMWWSLTRVLTTLTTSCAVKLSKPEVGSSRNSTRGSVMRATPTLVRFACHKHALSDLAVPQPHSWAAQEAAHVLLAVVDTVGTHR